MMTHSFIDANTPLDQIRRRRIDGTVTVPATMSPRDRRDLAELLAEEPDYVQNDAFSARNAEKAIFEKAVEIPQPNTSWYHPVMENLTSSRDVRGMVNVVLNKHQEMALFMQYNYARYRLAKLREKLGDAKLTDAQARELLDWYRKSMELRERIAQFNLALVLAMAKRVRGSELDFADLISEGNMALLRAIDKFDTARGFKFSTYACRAILKAFSRQGVKQNQYKTMFPTDFDPALEKSDYQRRRFDGHEEDCASEVRRIVERNAADLTDVEQQVIEHRFALGDEDAQPLTLEQVGKLVGLTKERVRQIQNKALIKIKRTLEASYLDGPHATKAEESEGELPATATAPGGEAEASSSEKLAE